jgi:hypothetical protein
MSNQEQRGNNDYFLADMAHEGWQERLDYLGWHLGNEVGRLRRAVTIRRVYPFMS